MTPNQLQDRRSWLRAGFFILFVLAPPLDIFRFDLTLGHLIVFGQPWTLGLDAVQRGEISSMEAAARLIFMVFAPLLTLAGGVLWISWKYGRLYCGWLCPHFSVVELINGLMRRASGKPTLWEKAPLPELQPDGILRRPEHAYWWVVIVAVIGFAFLWALTLLTYLLPPQEIYRNLLSASLTRNQAIFLSVATLAFSLEFLLARHLFCRFGCAVGLFQSLAWMGNREAMVVGFASARGKACLQCNNACDNACPMRLKPRSIKRKMFTCTQCAQCISACATVQSANPRGSLLHWVEGEAAKYSSAPQDLACPDSNLGCNSRS
jgi:polyferredoxin